jgi:hypothetical protein
MWSKARFSILVGGGGVGGLAKRREGVVVVQDYE